MRIHSIATLAVLALAAATCHAQSVHRCVDANGNSIYQTHACAGTGTAPEDRDLPPVRADNGRPDADAVLATRAPTARAAGQDSGGEPPQRTGEEDAGPSGWRAYNIGHQFVGACTAAKLRREEAFQELGKSRSPSITRYYDDIVAKACNRQ